MIKLKTIYLELYLRSNKDGNNKNDHLQGISSYCFSVKL